MLVPAVSFASASKPSSRGAGAGNAVKHALHWTYAGAEAPANWGNLSVDFLECKAGKRQSLINLNTSNAKSGNLYNLRTSYRPVMLNVKNNGHALQVNYHTLYQNK